jgi:Ca2+-binding RTX toxin-like protein
MNRTIAIGLLLSLALLQAAIARSVVTPVVPQPSQPGQVVGFVLRNSGTTRVTARDICFTQVFRLGQVPAGSGLIATVGGQTIPVQMDVLTTNSDGSAAMADLTMMQPAMAAGASEGVMLSLAPASSAAPINIAARASNGYRLAVKLTLHNADGSTTPYNLNAVSLLQHALAAGTASYVRQGPQVTEVQFNTPIAGSLYLTFDMSLYADGSVTGNVELNNDIAMSANGGTANYDVTITQNGATVLQQNGISQFQYTNWNQQLASNSAPQPQVVLDINALERTGAVPNYDPTVGVSASTIAGEASQLGGPTYGILGSASVTQYMPTTGGRGDIGPQPSWDAIWLMTQDPTAIQYALAQANVAGSVPWNFIDAQTGNYLTVTKYPNLWTDYRAVSNGSTALTQPVSGNTGWTPDAAHQPDLSYLAYLMTGNTYYLSELNAQASWAEAYDYPYFRQNSLGLMANGQDQVREQAWSLREVDEAAYANPNGSAMKAYFTQMSNNNWSWLVSQIPTWTQEEGQAYGYVPVGNTPRINPWQQDYFVSTAVQAAEMGNQDAVTFLKWESNFIVGRFLNAANGFNPHDGIAYNVINGTSSGGYLQTWAQIEQATQAAGDSNGTGWGSGNDYAAWALQSLAGVITVTQSVSAIQAYGWLLASGAPNTTYPIGEPQLDIVPRLSDGNLLTSNNIIISNDTTATTITGSNNDQLIYAGSGNDTLIGGTGINILFAGSGNDTLTGGPNNDYLFGGSGPDTLSAGAGTNYMQAGSGADIFQLSAQDAAQDTIAGFKIGIDHLHLLGSSATSSFENQLISGATTDAAGDAVLHLSPNHAVVLQGINTSQLSLSLFNRASSGKITGRDDRSHRNGPPSSHAE